MKNVLTTALFAAAAAATFAGTASAQDMKAEIPFRFHAGLTDLPAGTYRVERLRGIGSTPVYQLTNTTAGGSVMVVANSPIQDEGVTKPARLVFECGRAACNMTEVWSGNPTGYRFNVKHSNRDQEASQIAVVRLTSGSAK